MTDKSSATKTVAIPATIEDAVGALNGIDALLTAKGWERAAIVYAFTYDGRDSVEVKNRLSVGEFLKLKIAGLSSSRTVALYRSAWAEHGDPNIKPGDTVTLPTEDFPPRDDTNFGSRVSPEKAAATVGEWSPEAKAAAVQELIRDPEVTDTVVEEIVIQPDLIDKAEQHPMMQTPDVPLPPRKVYPDDVLNEIRDRFIHINLDVREATELLDQFIQNGWPISDLEFAALGAEPGDEFEEELIKYRQRLAMVPVDNKARI
jgi:hypothetical protein